MDGSIEDGRRSGGVLNVGDAAAVSGIATMLPGLLNS
jgi:hypothetical protein